MKTNIALSAVCLAAASAFSGVKDAYTGRFHVGAALGKWVYEQTPNAESDIVAANFSSITAENEMKPERVQPREGEFHWDSADKFVAFGERHGMKIIGHCLVWHYQTPDWFFKNAEGSKADRETLIARMRTHIHAVVGRYKGRVHGWDVVNEAFDDAGNLHPSPWRDGIGEDFIELAFRFAHEADPDAELCYNDFNMFNQNKIAGVLRMVREFRAKGVRIDGVGLQSHNGLGGPAVADYERSIQRIGAEGVKAMVTELDVSVLPNAWGLTADPTKLHDYEERYNPYTKGCPADVLEAQAKRYCELFEMYLRNSDIIDRVTLWGVNDATTWFNDYPVPGRTDYPLFFDKDLKAKPCAEAVEKLGREWKGEKAAVKPDGKQKALFKHFRVEGKDALPPCDEKTQFRNPIVDGMAPDPSVTRKGDDYYLANSSFGYFPGVPVWHSKDLVNWDFCGYVQSRKSQLDMKEGLDVNHGVYAPDIKYNKFNDTFYMIVSVVNAGGAMVYKTKDPYLGWGEPIHVAVPEIDPGIFFENETTAYIVNNDVAPSTGEEYPGHRTIRMRKYDLVNDKLVEGFEKIVVNKGVKPEDKPIWCEGPHLYKINGAYYLMTAEGGTGYMHSEVIYRAENVEGPYVPCKVNPILTQRDLPYGRENGVYCAGHADLFETADGEWMAVFLGIRPYARVGGGDYSPTGRNTYLLPVKWIGEGAERQPIILEQGKSVPLVVEKRPWQIAAGMSACAAPLSGNRVFEDRFETAKVDPLWIQLRTPGEFWYRSAVGGKPGMEIEARAATIYERVNPSYLCRWLTSRSFDVETTVEFSPRTADDIAGLALVQNECNNYVLGKTLDADGKACASLVRCDRNGRRVVASVPVADGAVSFRAEGRDEKLRFFLRQGDGQWRQIGGEEKADVLTTGTAGGFIGATIGMYATGGCAK